MGGDLHAFCVTTAAVQRRMIAAVVRVRGSWEGSRGGSDRVVRSSRVSEEI